MSRLAFNLLFTLFLTAILALLPEAVIAQDNPTSLLELNPKHISDAIITIDVTTGSFVDVLMVLSLQSNVSMVLQADWYNNGCTQCSGRNGTITMKLTEIPFDKAFGMLMQANNCAYIITSPGEHPTVYIGSRERLEKEFGQNPKQLDPAKYVDLAASIDFLPAMNLLPDNWQLDLPAIPDDFAGREIF